MGGFPVEFPVGLLGPLLARHFSHATSRSSQASLPPGPRSWRRGSEGPKLENDLRPMHVELEGAPILGRGNEGKEDAMKESSVC